MPVKISNEEFEKAEPAPAPVDTTAEVLADAAAAGFPDDFGPEGAVPVGSTETGPAPGTTPLPDRDSNGTPFDPERHRTGPDGTPLRNQDGSFRKKYRKKADGGEGDQFDATAKMVCLAIIKCAGVAFDAEEAAPDEDFKTEMTNAYAESLRAIGFSITNPHVNALAITYIYLAQVTQKPKSNVKFKTYVVATVDWIKRKIFRRKDDDVPDTI